MVALDGGNALDLFEVGDGVVDVLAVGNADGDAEDDAVVRTLAKGGSSSKVLSDLVPRHDS